MFLGLRVAARLAVFVALISCGNGATDTTQPPANDQRLWTITNNRQVLQTDAAGPLIVSDGFSKVSALSVANGATTWTVPWLPGMGGVYLLGGLVVAQRSDSLSRGIETYLDATTGTPLWSLQRSPGDQSSVVVIGATLVASVGGSILVGYEALTGREKWRTAVAAPSCTPPVLCDALRVIGVDGTEAYLLRRTSVSTQIITVRESGIVRQVEVADESVIRVAVARQLAVISGTGTIAVWSQNATPPAVIDVATGATRGRVDLRTLAASGFAPEANELQYSSNGRILLAVFFAATGVNITSFDLVALRPLQSRTLTREQFLPQVYGMCGAEGLTRLTAAGVEHMDLRTGVLTQIAVPGLLDAARAGGVGYTRPLGSDRILLTSQNGGSTMLGVKCNP